MTDTGWFALLLAYGVATELLVGQPQPVPPAPMVAPLPCPAWMPTELNIPSMQIVPFDFDLGKPQLGFQNLQVVPFNTPPVAQRSAPEMMIEEFRYPTTGIR